jgi:hypothetical protein
MFVESGSRSGSDPGYGLRNRPVGPLNESDFLPIYTKIRIRNQFQREIVNDYYETVDSKKYTKLFSVMKVELLMLRLIIYLARLRP